MFSYVIRKGKKEDCADVVRLATKLGETFGRVDRVLPVSEERLKEDGFGSTPLFKFFVAESITSEPQENKREIVGISSFCENMYNLFSGKSAYLHALVVEEHHRGRGLGTALLKATVNDCLEVGCKRLVWMVDAGNHRLVNFYKSFDAQNATESLGFEYWRFSEESMLKLNQDVKTHSDEIKIEFQ